MVWLGASDIGQRERQEDSWGVSGNLAVVCDGLGGHGGGDIASGICRSEFKLAWESDPSGSITDRLTASITQANKRLGKQERKDMVSWMRPMGTTLAAAVVVFGRVWWVSAGDSPLFLCRHDTGEVSQLNARHNTPGSQHELSSCLLGGWIPEVDLSTQGVEISPQDVLVLASDGIDTLTPDEIGGVIETAREGDRVIAEALVEQVMLCGKSNQDNVTVVASWGWS